MSMDHKLKKTPMNCGSGSDKNFSKLQGDDDEEDDDDVDETMHRRCMDRASEECCSRLAADTRLGIIWWLISK